MNEKNVLKAIIKYEKNFDLNKIEEALLKLDEVREVKVKKRRILITVLDKEKIDLQKVANELSKIGVKAVKINN